MLNSYGEIIFGSFVEKLSKNVKGTPAFGRHRSFTLIEWQACIIGATWLDQQLIGGGNLPGDLGFEAEAKDVLRERFDFLAEQRGKRVVLARNLLAKLRSRTGAGSKNVVAETSLEYRPLVDGQHVSGIRQEGAKNSDDSIVAGRVQGDAEEISGAATSQ